VWDLDPQKSTLVLAACGIGLAFLMTGFAASYLGLYREARRLFWWLVIANTVPAFVLIIVATVADLRNIGVWQFMPPLLGFVSLIAAAALRWRTGFKPAGLLLLGLCSMAIYFATSLALAASNATLPSFARWGFEIAVASDVLLFSLGMAYRDRFSKRAQGEVEHELRAATFAADHDPLTGLLNRRGLEAWLGATPDVAGTLLYLDLDGFKAVNDRGGHAAGDDTLRVVARIISHAVREEDRTARLGGDEFAIVLVNVRNREAVDRVSARISDAIGSLRPLGAQADVRIGVSAGIGRIARADSFERALREADGALYREKSEHHAFARLRAINASG
jgi:diguanylate cyclase (GGDEF)-like protein